MHRATARPERGASALEYALIAAGIAGVLLVALSGLFHSIGSRIDCVTGGLSGSGSCAPAVPGTGPADGGDPGPGGTAPPGGGAAPTDTTTSTSTTSTNTTTTSTTTSTTSTTTSAGSTTAGS